MNDPEQRSEHAEVEDQRITIPERIKNDFLEFANNLGLEPSTRKSDELVDMIEVTFKASPEQAKQLVDYASKL